MHQQAITPQTRGLLLESIAAATNFGGCRYTDPADFQPRCVVAQFGHRIGVSMETMYGSTLNHENTCGIESHPARSAFAEHVALPLLRDMQSVWDSRLSSSAAGMGLMGLRLVTENEAREAMRAMVEACPTVEA